MSIEDADRARGQIATLLSRGRRDALALDDFSAGLAAGLIYGVRESCPDVWREALSAVAVIRDIYEHHWHSQPDSQWTRPKYFQYPRAWPNKR